MHIPCRGLSHNDHDRKKDTQPEVWDIMADATGLSIICGSYSKSSMCGWLSKEGSIVVVEDRRNVIALEYYRFKMKFVGF